MESKKQKKTVQKHIKIQSVQIAKCRNRSTISPKKWVSPEAGRRPTAKISNHKDSINILPFISSSSS